METHHVRYVIIGSVAANLYEVECQPGDLDVAPALNRRNLIRLRQVLVDIEASLPETER